MQNLKGRNALTFISGDSLAFKKLAEAFDHRKNPATVAAQHYFTINGVCITHMWQFMLPAHWQARCRPLRLFAEVKNLGVRGRVCPTESYVILSRANQNLEPFLRSFLKVNTSSSVAKLSTASFDPRQP